MIVMPTNGPVSMSFIAKAYAHKALDPKNRKRFGIWIRFAARRFLEYLTSDDAQRYFADGNNEWPVVSSVKTSNPALKALGAFKVDQLPIGQLAMYRTKAQMVFDRAGFR